MTDISYEAKPVWRAYWPVILIGIATLILSIGPFFILWAIVDRHRKLYTVNEQKAEACQGIFRKTSKSIELENLHSVELTLTLCQADSAKNVVWRTKSSGTCGLYWHVAHSDFQPA